MTECDGIDVERDFWGRTMLEHLTCNRFHTPENFEPRPVGKRYSDLARRKANMSENTGGEVMMTTEQRVAMVEALMAAVGGLRINGQEAYDPAIQRQQIGKFVDLLVAATV